MLGTQGTQPALRVRSIVARIGLAAMAIVLVGCGVAAAAAPTASIQATPTTQERDTPIAFDATGSSDPDGAIASYRWDFGDGWTSTDPQPQHSYAFAGPKHVTLTVTDEEDLTATASADVTIAGASPIRPLAGCTASHLPHNDDDSSPMVPLGFTLHLTGIAHSHAWVNTNGTVSFDGPLWEYLPTALRSTGHELVAAFWADVNTGIFPEGSAVVGYGQTTLGGRPAFCVDWGDGGGVRYFGGDGDQLNRFQLLIVDRSDVATGAFDLELNYDQVRWEAGDSQDGTHGLGGTSARVGYSGGTGEPGTFFELPGSAINGALLDGGPNSLAATSTGSIVPGRHVLEVRNTALVPGGQIRGTVVSDDGTVANAPVQACPAGGGACAFAHTNDAGHYVLGALTAGDYAVTALPPSGDQAHHAEQVVVAVPQDARAFADLFLDGVAPLPSGTAVTNIGLTPGGEPILYWDDPLTISTTGCPEGQGSFAIRQEGELLREGVLALDHVDGASAGVFAGHAAALRPIHGTVELETIVDGCDNVADDRHDVWSAYVDPSGTVQTVAGQPLAGATVTLYRADGAGGPFEMVADGSDAMAPSNRRNPDATDARGHFGWDTLAGYYKVRASKAGCHAPASGADFVETGVLLVPPPVTDLRLTLDCGATAGGGGGPVGRAPVVGPPDRPARGCAARRGRARRRCLAVKRALAKCKKLKPRKRAACRKHARALGRHRRRHRPRHRAR